jgi:quercetin dioxygenase-like cupin family protein
MNIKSIANTEVFRATNDFIAKRLYDERLAQVVLMVINPGGEVKSHITPVDVLFYVLEGEGVVEIGDEKEKVVAGTIIESPAKIPHAWYNEGDEILRILIVKIPNPNNA